jgi:hypothetical protein
MSAMRDSTSFRGVLGFIQVVGLVVVAAAVQERSQPRMVGRPDQIYWSERPEFPKGALHLVENGTAMKQPLPPIGSSRRP